MKSRQFIIYILALSILVSCRATKRSNYTSIQSDSSRISAHSIIADSNTHSRTIERKDTLIIVPGSSLQQQLKQFDLLPNYDATGKAVAKIITQRKGALAQSITINPDSTISISASVDSLTFLVQNLYREISEIKLSSRRATDSTAIATKKEITYTELFQVIRPVFSIPLFWIAAAILVLLIIYKPKKQ